VKRVSENDDGRAAGVERVRNAPVVTDAQDLILARLGQLIASSPHNLVSRRDRGIVAEEHIPEAVAVASLLPLAPGARWLDLGTGGGLPGLVLAILAPEVQWTLLDSTKKKIAAVEDFAAELELRNVRAIAERAEVLARDPGHRGRYHGVIARAVAPLAVLCELSRGFVGPDGLLAAVKGPAHAAELSAAAPALALLRWTDVHTERVTSTARPTWVVRMRAEGVPPARYPRDVGVPRARPLGG
jgi:16S rRNA (guanine527-N7)-methyltransferase